MNRNDLLMDIKKRKTYTAADGVFERILSGVEACEQKSAPSHKKIQLLKPALIFYIIVLIIASTFAVTAAVNEDMRDYLISLFGGNPNSVDGELIGATVESEGIALTVDAVVAEGDSLFMIYTLEDKAQRVFTEATSIHAFKIKVGDDPNYTASYNSVIKSGEKNYMVLHSDGVKKGVQKVQFTLESLRTPDKTKAFALPAGTTSYKPEGIPGYTLDYIKLNNNRIEAAMTITKQEEYIHSFSMNVRNIKTGKLFYQQGEITGGNSEENIKTLQWYSEKLDGGNAEDYEFTIAFDKVYTFEKPLQADFSADFSRKPLKTLYPDNAKVLTAVIEKVTVHQMSIVADLRDTQKSVVQNDKPLPASDASAALFLDEERAPGIPGLRMTVRYEDGTEADLISGFTSSKGKDGYRFYLFLNGSLDYSRKPVLLVGDAGIPLY